MADQIILTSDQNENVKRKEKDQQETISYFVKSISYLSREICPGVFEFKLMVQIHILLKSEKPGMNICSPYIW